VKLALIGEAFNLFNHTNVSGVNTTAFFYAAAGSGNSTGSLIWGPRQLQVSGRLTF
jgi:hypothetical protein